MSASFTAVLTKGTNGTGSSITVTGTNLTIGSIYNVSIMVGETAYYRSIVYNPLESFSNSTTFLNLVDGVYMLSAIDQSTNLTIPISPYTITIYTTVPAAPTINGISVGDGTITIDYNEGVSNTLITANQAFIYSDNDLTSLMTQAGVTIGPSAAMLDLTTLTVSSSFVNGSTYYLTIKSTNENGTSEQSVSSSFTYSAPSNPSNPPPSSGPFLAQPTPSVADSNVSMSSSLEEAAGQTVTLWQWESSTDGITWDALQGGDVADVNGLYTIITAAPTTGVLYYRATATLSDGSTKNSNPCAVEQLTYPTELLATPGDGKVTLSWTSDAVTFEVLQLAGGSSSVIATVTGTSYEVTGLTNGTSYTFQVRSIVGTPADGYDTTTYKFIASSEAETSATPVAPAALNAVSITSTNTPAVVTPTTITSRIKGLDSAVADANIVDAPASGVTTTVWDVKVTNGTKGKGDTQISATIGTYAVNAGVGETLISGLTPNTEYWIISEYNTYISAVAVTTTKYTATATYNDGETTTTTLVVDMALDSEDSGPFSGVSFELHKMGAMNNDLGVIYSSVQNSVMWNDMDNQFSFTGLSYELGNTYKLLFEAVNYALLTKSNLNVKSGIAPPTNNTATPAADNRTIDVAVGEKFVAGIQIGEPGETAVWAITGGANQALFELVNPTFTGVTLQFKTAPTAATTTPYYVTVYQTSTTIPAGGNVEINYTVNVVDTTPLAIVSYSKSVNTYNIGVNTINVSENTTAVATFTANTSGVTWTLAGADADKFNIDSSSGAVTFKSAPDYENPTDADTNNQYEITVTATLGAETDSKNITVHVIDDTENSGGAGSGGGSGGGSGAVCFLADAPVLTPVGYRPISSIAIGDKVRTAAGRDVVVKRVFAKQYEAGPTVNPFVIPKGSFGALRSLPISPNHEVMTAKGMVKAKDLGLPRMKMAGSFTYYNLELEDWVHDNLVVAGVECESLAPAKRITMTKAEFARFVAARYGHAAAARLRLQSVCFEEADGSVSMPAFK